MRDIDKLHDTVESVVAGFREIRELFRINYPEFQNHKIHLGLATMAFYPELEEKCREEGIAIVKQDGDNVIINYDNLKAF